MFHTEVAEKIKNTHFVFNNFFIFSKSCGLWYNNRKTR